MTCFFVSKRSPSIREMGSDLYTLLSAIQKRPGMYLRRPSLSLLASLIFGYEEALQANVLDNQENPPFRAFQSWVVMKLQSSEANVYWCDLILEFCSGNEELAFNTFFRFLDEFKNRKEKILRSVELPLPSTPKTEKVLRSDGRYYRKAPECLVQIVEYSGIKGVFIRCTDTRGKLIDEKYSASFELGLEFAKCRHGIGDEDWKLQKK